MELDKFVTFIDFYYRELYEDVHICFEIREIIPTGIESPIKTEIFITVFISTWELFPVF